jgi:hypothetical protein
MSMPVRMNVTLTLSLYLPLMVLLSAPIRPRSIDEPRSVGQSVRITSAFATYRGFRAEVVDFYRRETRESGRGCRERVSIIQEEHEQDQNTHPA